LHKHFYYLQVSPHDGCLVLNQRLDYHPNIELSPTIVPMLIGHKKDWIFKVQSHNKVNFELTLESLLIKTFLLFVK